MQNDKLSIARLENVFYIFELAATPIVTAIQIRRQPKHDFNFIKPFSRLKDKTQKSRLNLDSRRAFK